MTTLLEAAKAVIDTKEKIMWAGKEFFPIREYSAGLYLCRSPIKPDDKQVFVSDNNIINNLARAVLILMEEFRHTMKHLRECSYDLSSGDEGDYCTCRLRERKQAIDQAQEIFK